MQNLPNLPGMNFEKRFKSRHHVPHCFEIVNGYAVAKLASCAPGNQPTSEQSVSAIKPAGSAILHDPVLTYGKRSTIKFEPFQPQFLLYDKKLLNFFAFFKQSVADESSNEYHRIRNVNIIYFLEDDTITVIEKEVLNSGLPQGRLIRRGKIAKNIKGECYNWKDFNLGIDIELNGFKFHITECDRFTKDFLISQGIELKETKSSPFDPVSVEQAITSLPRKQNKFSSGCDKFRRILEHQGKILKFDCILYETDRPGSEFITYSLYYYLEDDTVSIKELKENAEGRDRFPMFLKRTKLPKNASGKLSNICSMISGHETTEYYSPKDFLIDETISVFGKRFLLVDCDQFTRRYYHEILKIPQKEKPSIEHKERVPSRRPIPDYLGLGTPEDSLASCFSLTPKAPKRDIVKYLFNTNKFLRYGCILDTEHPEDKKRKFILSYSLADDRISIMEPPIKNSGIVGGRFLTSKKVIVPGCDRNDPMYYEPKNFFIGASLLINDHRFIITSADLYVYTYMKNYPELFSPEAVQSVANYLGHQLNNEQDAADDTLKEKDPPNQHVDESNISNLEARLQKLCLEWSVKKSETENLENLIKQNDNTIPANDAAN